MSILSKVSNFFSRTEILKPATYSSAFSSFMTSLAGITVTNKTAMKHTTVFSCLIVLSEGVAGLPLHTYKRTKKGKEKATTHRLSSVLQLKPNDEMTSFTFIQALMLNLLTTGNAFAQIIRDKRGNITQLYPLISSDMQIKRSQSGEIGFLYTSSKHGQVFLNKDEVLNIVGHSMDGIEGISPISMNANSIGLSMAMEQYGSQFFKNGANATGVFKTPNTLEDKAFLRLKNDLAKNYMGLMNAGKPMILEGGLDFSRISISNNDSQFLESRKYQRSEIASIFKVPLHMINDLEKSSFNNMEQQSLDFATHSLRPWLLRIEQAMTTALFDDNKHFVRFNMSALLRGDTKTRYEAYGMGIRDGWLTRNEARESEDLNPIDGLYDPILPLNMSEKTLQIEKTKEKKDV